MKISKKIIVVLLIVSLILSMGCAKKEEKITFGEMKDNTYTNKYFNLEFKVTEGWNIATKEELDEFTTSSNENAAEGDNALDPEKLRVLALAMAAKYPMTYSEGLNPNINLLSENLKLVTDVTIKNAEDYLTATKTAMEQAGMPYTFGEITTEKLGNKEFKAFDLSMELEGFTLKQKQYVTLIKDHALIFTLTYTNDEEYKELSDILNTVKFK